MVVLVHGGTIPLWTWDRQVPVLIAAGYRVLRYDAFGRGYSDRPAVVHDRNLYMSQLRELVDTLGISGPFDLIGTSQGGGTAVTFTATYPQRVRRLVLISPVVRDFAVPRLFQVPIIGEIAARAFGMRLVAK
jgi:pimeloyl-ACP methyl ester carboxylesterase